MYRTGYKLYIIEEKLRRQSEQMLRQQLCGVINTQLGRARVSYFFISGAAVGAIDSKPRLDKRTSESRKTRQIFTTTLTLPLSLLLGDGGWWRDRFTSQTHFGSSRITAPRLLCFICLFV